MSRDLKLIIPAALIFLLALFGIYRLYQVRVARPAASPTPASSPSGFEQPTPTPTPTTAVTPPPTQPDSGSETADGKNIGIFLRQPFPNTMIQSPVKVTGHANVFEGYVRVRIKDSSGNILGEGFATACMDVEPCPFETSIAFKTPQSSRGTVEAYSPSPKDGAEDYLQTIPVNF